MGYMAGLGGTGLSREAPVADAALGRAGRRGDPLTLLLLIAAFASDRRSGGSGGQDVLW